MLFEQREASRASHSCGSSLGLSFQGAACELFRSEPANLAGQLGGPQRLHLAVLQHHTLACWPGGEKTGHHLLQGCGGKTVKKARAGSSTGLQAMRPHTGAMTMIPLHLPFNSNTPYDSQETDPISTTPEAEEQTDEIAGQRFDSYEGK